MAQPTSEDMIADLYAGTVRTLEAICKHLIDARVINAELLLADLTQAQVDLVGKVGNRGSVPSALYAVLGGKPPESP